MKVLALEKEIPGVSQNRFTPYLREEASRGWELYRAGILRELYFDKNNRTAVIVMECEDVYEAEEILKTLPLVREGLISFEIVPLEPYLGFSRLFTE